jgi:hypothetical protein
MDKLDSTPSITAAITPAQPNNILPTNANSSNGIFLSIERLEYQISNLENNLTNLYQTLTPILKSDTSDTEKEKPYEISNDSALKDRIDRMSIYIAGMNHTLNYTSSRIDF